MQLDEALHLILPGMRVLDIGAAPGSWLQYTGKKLHAPGHVLGLDLQPIVPIGPTVTTTVCDVCDHAKVLEALTALGWKQVDLILSDAAPNTSGIRDVDQWRSVELNQRILALCKEFLRPGGNAVFKVFRGADFDAFTHDVRRVFQSIKVISVTASRDRSKEVYIVGVSRQ